MKENRTCLVFIPSSFDQNLILRFFCFLDVGFFLSGHSNLTILEQGLNEANKRKYTAQEEWLWLLKDALRSIGMEDQVSLDFIAGHIENAAVGVTPGHRQRNMYIKAKAENGWKQYEYEEVMG
jgi:hypothetical protein